MPPPSYPEVTLTSGFVVRKNLVYLLTEGEEVTEDDSNTGLVMKLAGTSWKEVALPFTGLIGIDVVEGKDPEKPAEVTVVGVDGEYFRAGAMVKREEGNIDASVHGPSGRGWIRGMRRIGAQLFAVGMSRQAYLRGPDGRWRHIDPDLAAKKRGASKGGASGSKKAVGLNDVDGFSEEEVYAAGLGGEIWRWDGSHWHSIHSPTNVSLQAVRRCGDGIYIAGGAGVVLRGRGDNFEVVATEGAKVNLHGLEELGSEIYVASLRSVYRLADGDLELVDTKLGKGLTTGHLHASDGVLWSVGAQHAIKTEDGLRWTQVFI